MDRKVNVMIIIFENFFLLNMQLTNYYFIFSVSTYKIHTGAQTHTKQTTNKHRRAQTHIYINTYKHTHAQKYLNAHTNKHTQTQMRTNTHRQTYKEIY